MCNDGQGMRELVARYLRFTSDSDNQSGSRAHNGCLFCQGSLVLTFAWLNDGGCMFQHVGHVSTV